MLFVPVFNFYWIFFTYVRLTEDLAKADGNRRNDNRHLAIAFGVVWITSWIFGFTFGIITGPLAILYVALDIALYVVWMLLTLRVVKIANELIGEESPQTQAKTQSQPKDAPPFGSDNLSPVPQT